MSETSRTDAIFCDESYLTSSNASRNARLANHARTLERELSQALSRVRELEADGRRVDALERQRRWGDCFTVEYLDSGDALVRPWRYANQTILNGSGEPLGKTYTAYANVRDALDAILAGDKANE